MSEKWEQIKAQIDAQINALKFMDKYGVDWYHHVNNTQFRNFENIKYTPLNGANADRLWEAAEVSFEMDSEIQKNKARMCD